MILWQLWRYIVFLATSSAIFKNSSESDCAVNNSSADQRRASQGTPQQWIPTTGSQQGSFSPCQVKKNICSARSIWRWLLPLELLQHKHEQTVKPHHTVHNTACKEISPGKERKKKMHLLNPRVDINVMAKAIFNEANLRTANWINEVL